MPMRSAPMLLLLLVVGCGSVQTRTYSISLRNDTPNFVTIALTKDGPPYSEAWASPEDIAAGRVKLQPDSELGTTSIGPGGTGSVQNVTGRFHSGDHAILRVYEGTSLRVETMLAMKPGPSRADYQLKPGNNSLTVRENAGALLVEPTPATPPSIQQ